jgi:uncharacterized protein (TIGR02246 family)
MNVGISLLALLLSAGVSPAEKGHSEFDSLLDTYTAAWNTHDGDSLGALFTDDADLIMANLPRIDGREAIGDWWNTYFSRINERREGEFELLSVREMPPGVRLVNVRSRTFGAHLNGEELESRLVRGTWVLIRRDGTWLIAAMRRLPAEGERRLRPGEDR